MQTRLADWIRDTPQGREAEDILRACVHCGFCNATCPTYRLLGDELDGPRGRIYQMKQMFEGGAVSTRTLTHLDRCLTCRNCETTCPSGVRYGRLLDIGREAIAGRVDRSLPSRWLRTSLRWFLKSSLFGASLDVARLLRPALRERLRRRIPAARPAGARPQERHARRMLVLEGCVQPELSPDINAAAARVLDRLGIELVGIHGCCGALDQHLGATEAAREQMRRNIDAWWPEIENGAEAIVMTA
ncbi:MAG: glycolate oxidase subunit GlcF, partial [Chromatiales bacterium]|nr:glycolate oxidase subunit GlcF [Chromatiales bacterium]